MTTTVVHRNSDGSYCMFFVWSSGEACTLHLEAWEVARWIKIRSDARATEAD